MTAWFDQGSSTICISTQADRIYLNEISDVMFSHFAGLKNLDIGIIDTSSITSMFAMFEGCSSLTEVITDNQELLEEYVSRNVSS